MEKSESLNELALALAKAQGAMKPALKDADNPFFKSKYADIASVWEACREPLADNNLSIVQLPEPADNAILLTTILLHSSGQYLSSQLRFPITKSDPQSYGSALTYARRYALAAAVGVYQDDDDANSASDKEVKQNNNRAANKQNAPTLPNSPNTQRNNATNTNTPTQQQNAPTSQNEQPSIKWDTFYGNVKNLGLDEQKVKEIASQHYGKAVTSLKDVINTQQELNQFLSVLSKHRQQPQSEESITEKRRRLMEKTAGYDQD